VKNDLTSKRAVVSRHHVGGFIDLSAETRREVATAERVRGPPQGLRAPVPGDVLEAAGARLDDDHQPRFAMLLVRERLDSIAQTVRAAPAEIDQRAGRIVERLRLRLRTHVCDRASAAGNAPTNG
jgi:hypothetical protein